MATTPVPYPAKPKSWLERHFVLAISIGVGLVVVLTIAFVVAIFAFLSNSEPEKLAFAKAQANQAVTERLGQPLKKGLFTQGSIRTTGPSGHAELKVPISGPRGSGYIYLTADMKADRWSFESCEVAIDGEEKRIELVEPAPTVK